MSGMRGLAVFVLGVLASAVAVASQVEPVPPTSGEGAPVEMRLEGVADRLRLAMTLSTLAVLSPTLVDARLHAQRVVNLLEGTVGRHFVARLAPEGEVRGLLVDVRGLVPWLARKPIDPPLRETVLSFAKNIATFLDLALEAALASLGRRHLDLAAEDMRRAFAYLSAALGPESGPTYLGGVLDLLRLLEAPAEAGTPAP